MLSYGVYFGCKPKMKEVLFLVLFTPSFHSANKLLPKTLFLLLKTFGFLLLVKISFSSFLPRTGVHKYADGFGMNDFPSKISTFLGGRSYGVSFGCKTKQCTVQGAKCTIVVENLRFSPLN